MVAVYWIPNITSPEAAQETEAIVLYCLLRLYAGMNGYLNSFLRPDQFNFLCQLTFDQMLFLTLLPCPRLSNRSSVGCPGAASWALFQVHASTGEMS